MREPWADNGLIKERVLVGRSWAGPVSLFSPTLANGVIVLGWEGAGALAWELLGTCPEGHRGGCSFFAWPQNGSSVLGHRWFRPQWGYLVLVLPAVGGSRHGCPTQGSLKGAPTPLRPTAGKLRPR